MPPPTTSAPPEWQSAYLQHPARYDALLGLLIAGAGGWLLHYAYPRLGLALAKPALTATADQLCSASIAMAGFLFTAHALLVSLGDSHRTKLSDEELGSQAHPPPAQVANRFESFFTTDSYLLVTGGLLGAITELYATFGLLVLLKFLWVLLPDWLCQAILLFSLPLLAAPLIRSVRMVGRVHRLHLPHDERNLYR